MRVLIVIKMQLTISKVRGAFEEEIGNKRYSKKTR